MENGQKIKHFAYCHTDDVPEKGMPPEYGEHAEAICKEVVPDRHSETQSPSILLTPTQRPKL